jgi:pimeloyl-ACP methyl ester carboxylesterase
MLIKLLHKQIRRRYQRLGYQSKFLELHTCRIHYYELKRPQAPYTLLLLHGLGTSASTWINTLSKLQGTYSVLAPDLPGYGLSTISNGRPFLTVPELASAVNSFVHHTIESPLALLGHSLGGWLAGLYARDHVGGLQRLILVNNAGIFYEGIEQQGALFQVQSIQDVRKLLNALWYRYPWYFKLFYPAVLNDLQERRVADFVRSVHREDFLNDQLRTFPARLDLIWGRNDRLIPPETIDIIKQSIPGAGVHFIERCGHVPQLERPKEFTAILNRLLP